MRSATALCSQEKRAREKRGRRNFIYEKIALILEMKRTDFKADL